MSNSSQERWTPGTTTLQREYWRHQLVTVRPATVVVDTAEMLALYFPAGNTFLHGGMRGRQQLPLEDRVRVYLSDDQPTLVEMASHVNVLTLTPPGERHAVWLFWDDAWRFRTWYVNLQAPLRRTRRSVIVSDHLLDLVVTPDLVWSWKDEDEFEAVCAAGGVYGKGASLNTRRGRAVGGAYRGSPAALRRRLARLAAGPGLGGSDYPRRLAGVGDGDRRGPQ